jgi:hypothetical protein
LAAMAKQSHFKEAALAAQALASEEEEGETQAMMFALLQDQYESQLDVMDAANMVTMDAMIKHMNTILGGGSGSRTSKQNKETPPPAINANRGREEEVKKVKHKKMLCSHCNMFVFHKPDRCYALEANKDKQ